MRRIRPLCQPSVMSTNFLNYAMDTEKEKPERIPALLFDRRMGLPKEDVPHRETNRNRDGHRSSPHRLANQVFVRKDHREKGRKNEIYRRAMDAESDQGKTALQASAVLFLRSPGPNHDGGNEKKIHHDPRHPDQRHKRSSRVQSQLIYRYQREENASIKNHSKTIFVASAKCRSTTPSFAHSYE